MGRSNELENDVDVGDCSNLINSHAFTGAEVTESIVVTIVTSDGHGDCAECSRDLDGGQAHATSRAGDEHPLIRRDVGVQNEGIKGRGEGFGEAAGLGVGNGRGDRDEVFGRYDTVGRLTAPTDNGSHPITQGNGSDVETNGVHHAGTFEAGNVAGPTGRCGIKAASLQEICGIEAGRSYFDYDVIGAGLGCFLRDNLQFVVVDLHCSHGAPS
ncbi:unannotated protein [freshwater metagenome]|uniref:Unannotated protein n=1 Tax=freshwater metagenome TaxID=449393 RepID=A0A6J7DCA7_9ZZZZ